MNIAENKLKELRTRQNKEKAMQWQEVKEKSPRIANFMSLVAKHTGKFEKVQVWFKNVLILEK